MTANSISLMKGSLATTRMFRSSRSSTHTNPGEISGSLTTTSPVEAGSRRSSASTRWPCWCSSRARPGSREDKERRQRVIPEVTTQYQGWLSDIVFLDPQPSTMRDYSFTTERTLSGDGANLSGVLFNLCREKATRREVLQFIQALPEQDIRSIGFIETPRSEAMVKLTETFGGRKTGYDATLLSDGTLRVLAIAAAVLSAPERSIVVIEEIDNGVHPSRAEQILSRLSRIAEERGLRVLISSHNPALLDALPDDAVPNVVFCYRDPKTGTSRLVRLADIPDYPELIAQGAVGHLVTRGILDRIR